MNSEKPLPIPSEQGSKDLLAPGVAITEVVDDFLATWPNLQTRRAYRGALVAFCAHAGIREAGELHPEALPLPAAARRVRAYLDSVTRRQADEPYAVTNPATVNARAAALNAFFGWLRVAYGYPFDPVAAVHTTLRTAGVSTTDSLTREEVEALLQRAERAAGGGERRDYLVVAMLFGMALRRSEVARLTWADVDFGHQVVRVERNRQQHELPLPAKLAGYLAEHAKASGGGRYVFRPRRGASGAGEERPLSTKSVFLVVRELARQAVPGKTITPHSLRKTFIELALADGEPLQAIMNATGHARPEMLRYYAKRDRLRDNAIHQVARYL